MNKHLNKCSDKPTSKVSAVTKQEIADANATEQTNKTNYSRLSAYKIYQRNNGLPFDKALEEATTNPQGNYSK